MRIHALLTAVVLAAPIFAGCFGFGGGDIQGTPTEPLSAAFQFQPEKPGVGDEIQFRDTSKGSVADRQWDFGDGATSKEPNPVHSYDRSDVYLVRLTVRDAAGNTSVAERFVGVDVHVADGKVSVAIDADVKGLTVAFRALVSPTDAPISQYYWDFGDESVARDKEPIHTYEEAGSYEVVLRVTSNGTVYDTGRTVDVGSFAELGPLASRPFAVIAIVDTGINPYHEEFRDSAFQDHPSTYVNDYPADAEALPVTLTASQYSKAVAADEELWEGVGRNTLYYVPGTRIVGAISISERGEYPILDDAPADGGHGTATASIAAGDSIGVCPTCLIVVVEGLGEDPLQWAMEQPWIDVVSNSWGVSIDNVCLAGFCGSSGIVPPPASLYGIDHQAARDAVEAGKTVLFASGNGWLNAFDVPQVSYTNPYTGPDWFVVVGASDSSSDATVVGTGRPVDVVSYGLDWKGASHTSQSAIRSFSGTSSATPVVAGAFGSVLQGARDALNDTHEGPHGAGVIAKGDPPGDLGSGSLLSDGVFTRAESQRIIFLTARTASGVGSVGPVLPTTLPNSAAYFLYSGYGVVDHATAQSALDVALGSADAPQKAAADQWDAVDAQIRVALWGGWNDGGGLRGGPAVPSGLTVDDVDEWSEVVALFADVHAESDASLA